MKSNSKNFALWIILSISKCILLRTASHSTRADRQLKLSENDDPLYMRDILRASKAAEVQSYLNENVDPCNNFYEFACSKFEKYHPARPGQPSQMLQIMAEALNEKIASFLKTSEKATDILIDRKIKRFYISCLKLKELTPEEYKAKLLTIISEFGKMPVLSNNTNWDEQNFDWLAIVAKMQRVYARPALLQLIVAPDYRDRKINCLYIGQPRMLMDSKAIYNGTATVFHRNLVTKGIANRLEQFLGVPKPLAIQTANEITGLEILLSQNKMETDELFLPITIEQFQVKYEMVIDIERYIRLTVGTVSTDCLYEAVENFQANLRNLLPKIEKYVVANYLFYMLIHDDFTINTGHDKHAQERLCLARTYSYFNSPLDNMIYRQYDIEKSENDIKLIFEHLKMVLGRKFAGNELDWMHAKARFNALEKLKRSSIEIKSHEHENSSFVFDDLEVSTFDYLQNVKNLFLLKGKQFVESVYELPHPQNVEPALLISPTNLVQQNKIFIPVAILQPYFLWAEVYPYAFKFGNLGTMLAHELLHNFDYAGRKYDKNGDQINWWDLNSIQAFNERKKCFVEQYNNYQFGDNYVRGDLSLAENIAENGGIKLAFDAYMLWYNNPNRTAPEILLEQLTQLKFTPARLFFVSFAQLWCTDMNDDDKNLQAATDTYAPNVFRVIGSLSNSPDFSATFKCPIGASMNPAHRCNIY